MKARLFPPGGAALIVDRPAIHVSFALPGEKIHRFHLAHYGLGLVLGECCDVRYTTRSIFNLTTSTLEPISLFHTEP